MKNVIKDIRFEMPTDKQIIEVALLFNEGKIEQEKLVDIFSVVDFILQRLFENGNILKPSSKEKRLTKI